MLTVARYITIMLCALALALGLSQALAARPDPALFTPVAALLSAAAASSLILAAMLRQRPGFALAAWGTLLLALAAILWALPIVPGRGLAWLAPLQDNTVIVALATWLAGFSLVVLSAIRQPILRRAPRGPLPLLRRIIP